MTAAPKVPNSEARRRLAGLIRRQDAQGIYPVKLAALGAIEQTKGWLAADLQSRGSE